jgi:coproporphyrinogen III oxidase
MNSSDVRKYLAELQQKIVEAIEYEDGFAFRADPWKKDPKDPLQGQGITMILEGGAVFERAGVGLSHVSGLRLPPSATAQRSELEGAPFEAMGVSLVMHPLNPYVPTVHMNVRMIEAKPAGGEPVRWFGGGMDLTPYYGFEDDCIHFHQVCHTAVESVCPGQHKRFKDWCDDYFVLKHRGEQRGIGGIFFDDITEFGDDAGFALIRSVGDSFLNAYLPIVKNRRHTKHGKTERAFQLYRRGRYVEFNLVWDRGTHFGLQSGGRTESILLSMPPLVSWSYSKKPMPGSAEEILYKNFLVRKDWI